MGQEQHLEIGLDQALKQRIEEQCIREGQLFGSVPQSAFTLDERMQLAQAGWLQHDYHDAPVMEAPQTTIQWDSLRARHRDATLHAISHRLKEGAPWVGTRQEILEELLASTWDQQEDELRTLLHAFAFASIWGPEDPSQPNAIESRETFFFYTDRMRDTALQAADYATAPPPREDEFWTMVSSLEDI